MREAIHFYRRVQKQYMWLHVIFGLVFASTAVFWFITPLFIISYGLLDLTSIKELLVFLLLFLVPALIITLHCWYISFQAARQWTRHKDGRKQLHWLLLFQLIAFLFASSFTIGIYAMFLGIDYLLY